MTSTAYASDVSGDFTRAETVRRLNRLNRLARLMDTAIRIPGTEIRFGADAILGLVPGIGDASGAAIGLFIVNEARRMGVPKRKLARMVANLGVDAAVGAVPLAGDLFDVYFKSHKRNIAIVADHFDIAHREFRDGPDERTMKDVTPKR
ncbi:DUF4112 domain-containing protein [Aureimonas sp. AU12]|uniref:DUF4112 domain-containing protein n=1 Tax=Aureimonas sp. AU12 TaxID=1638161 RepID=UPI000781C27A|nr:DUF4112 domain-containing protein [Aureimonas sp. AU12]